MRNFDNALGALGNLISTGGVTNIRFKDYAWIARDEYKDLESYFRAVIESHLGPLNRFTSMRFRRTKIGVQEALISYDSQGMEVHVAPLLLLPKVGGLRALQEFLVRLRLYFLSHSAESPVIRITNQKDPGKRTYAELWCLFYIGDMHTPHHDEDYEDDLLHYINSNGLICSWLRTVALDLNRLGPHSWIDIRPEDVIDPLK